MQARLPVRPCRLGDGQSLTALISTRRISSVRRLINGAETMPVDPDSVAVPVGHAATTPGVNSTSPRTAANRPETDQAATAYLTPPIDIYEGPDGLVLEADLPGVPNDQLTIQLEDNVLNLRGKVFPQGLDGALVLHQEYHPGDFGRSFILSDEVDRSKITASLKNGVLRVTLPKAERSRTRRIEIRTS